MGSAPCPVLVARRPTADRLLLCTDGSDGALRAERFLATSPALAGRPITVLSVAETHHPAAAALLPGIGALAPDEVIDRRRRALTYATDAARRLSTADRVVRARLAAGDLGTQVDEAVIASGADVVVLGADDRRGWSRMLLGGVAREILAATDASVLVVRAGAMATRPARRPDRCCRGPTRRGAAVPN